MEVGGGRSTKGVASDGPQDEADASKAGKAAAKRCTVLAPLLLKEVFRQVQCAGVHMFMLEKQ